MRIPLLIATPFATLATVVVVSLSVARGAEADPILTLGREGNWLLIRRADLPGGQIRVNYLEAYCRAGSTDADWVQRTVTPHRAELLSLSDDRRTLRLGDTLADGVTVQHTITAKDDEVDFQLRAHNPGAKRSEAHWAQACPRLADFTGFDLQGKDLDDYLPKCFIFLGGKLARLSEVRPWAKEAHYTPGQVWSAPGVPRTDVNPRPLSPLVPDNGLIGAFSRDAKLIFATAWEPYQELFQGVARCLHSDFRLGGLQPGETKLIRGKIYLATNDVPALLARYRKDFPEHANSPSPQGLGMAGMTVTPHLQSTEMRYRREPDFSLGARVQVFLQNTTDQPLSLPATSDVRLRGRTPEELLRAGGWAWHDFPSAWTNEPLTLPPGALTVWSWNGRRADWGTNTSADLLVRAPQSETPSRCNVAIANPQVWLSTVTFLGAETNPFPDSVIFHVANDSRQPLRLEACRLWLPARNQTWRALLPQPWMTNLERFPADGNIAAQDRGGARVSTGRLPLTYAALEVQLADAQGKPLTLWAHVRVKREWFDISGGWVASRLANGSSTLQCEPFLKTLRRMHVNTGHIADTGGYTDQTGPDGLYTRYPLKYFNKLEPFSHYDTDEVLPRIHAVEFLGEPQYGGGRPVPPMEVWRKLAPYAATRLPTTVTHSEERIWRFYAGLSDFPHYDAYRVSAPSPDIWSKYDRWDGQTIRWGAPLETIGEMCRSLRELNRPMPTAYWSQGAHEGWEVYGGRKRTSPTPDELRAQAYYALASRITSLYWFNLSLKSLVKFPDLIEPMTRIGHEIRMLDDFYLEGDATSHERILRDGKPDWDLDVVAGPRGALLFALDLDYQPDPAERVFKFGPPREAIFRFRLPAYASKLVGVFRVDADGVTTVEHKGKAGTLEIRDRASRVEVYVAATRTGERERLEARRRDLIAKENSLGFDPGRNASDLEVLKQLLDPARK